MRDHPPHAYSPPRYGSVALDETAKALVAEHGPDKALVWVAALRQAVINKAARKCALIRGRE